MTEVQGDLIVTLISEDNQITWKTIICETDSQASDTAATTDTKTKCATFSSISVDPTKISGNGVAVGNASNTQMSYSRLLYLLKNKTKVWVLRQNAAVPADLITSGEVTYHRFQGYISSLTETSAEGDITKFTYEITSTGDVDVDPTS